jgi:8-oxo-dGTP diphosphatase
VTFDTELWFDGVSEVSFVAAKEMPSDVPVTAVKIFDITDKQILLVEVPEKNGWDIPGGHIEHSETPEEAAIREVREETNGTVSNLSLFGYMVFKKVKETEKNRDYPEKSLIAMFQGEITNINDSIQLEYESTNIAYFGINEVGNLSSFWTRLSQQIMEYVASLGSE